MSEADTAAAETIDPKVARDRAMLQEAEAKGTGAKLGVFVKLSGPGWLQSAITLGGGSLSGALFLGVLGGVSMLWLQLVAIIMGVIMLSAISYVTLTTGKKPFRAINEHINPGLGWSWALATMTANMLWCMPQFSLSYAAVTKNLSGGSIPDTMTSKIVISAVLLVLATGVVILNARKGTAAKVFDWVLKALVGLVVVCFFGVVVYLGVKVGLDWGSIAKGFIPDLSQWSSPSGDLLPILQTLPESAQTYWSDLIVSQQRDVMIGAAATAVGINMTFLLPYSMLNRGWDKTFRGLARFDLGTGMAIPYVLVTSCVVIAAATQFHAKVDDALLSNDPAVMATSDVFGGVKDNLIKRAALTHEGGADAFNALAEEAQLTAIATLPEGDKRLAAAAVKRNAFQLSKSLAPLLGEDFANVVFGIGVLGMGFSTIIILMLINGYVVCEILGKPQGGTTHIIGCLMAGMCGAIWPFVWDGPAKLWLAITVSAFGMMLLPIAYTTFFFMLNSKGLMGKDKPTGGRLLTWNVLMGISVIGAFVAAGSAVYTKASHPVAGPVVWTVLGIFIVALVAGFFLKPKSAADWTD